MQLQNNASSTFAALHIIPFHGNHSPSPHYNEWMILYVCFITAFILQPSLTHWIHYITMLRSLQAESDLHVGRTIHLIWAWITLNFLPPNLMCLLFTLKKPSLYFNCTFGEFMNQDVNFCILRFSFKMHFTIVFQIISDKDFYNYNRT